MLAVWLPWGQIQQKNGVFYVTLIRRSHLLNYGCVSVWLQAEGASTRFMVASGGVLSEGYEQGGPGVCLGDGQAEAE